MTTVHSISLYIEQKRKKDRMWYKWQNDILILGYFKGFLTNKYRANDTDGVCLAQISTI